MQYNDLRKDKESVHHSGPDDRPSSPHFIYEIRGTQNDRACHGLSVGAVQIEKNELQSGSAGSCRASHDRSTQGETEPKVDSGRGPHRQVHLIFTDSPCGEMIGLQILQLGTW